MYEWMTLLITFNLNVILCFCSGKIMALNISQLTSCKFQNKKRNM